MQISILPLNRVFFLSDSEFCVSDMWQRVWNMIWIECELQYFTLQIRIKSLFWDTFIMIKTHCPQWMFLSIFSPPDICGSSQPSAPETSVHRGIGFDPGSFRGWKYMWVKYEYFSWRMLNTLHIDGSRYYVFNIFTRIYVGTGAGWFQILDFVI